LIAPRRQFLIAVLGAIAGAGIGAALRYFAIEVHEIGQLCDPGTGPLWCLPRQAIVQIFLIRDPLGIGVLGAAALLAGLGALIQGGRIAIYIAVALGGFGCVLYNADLAAIGLILGLLAAARH